MQRKLLQSQIVTRNLTREQLENELLNIQALSNIDSSELEINEFFNYIQKLNRAFYAAIELRDLIQINLHKSSTLSIGNLLSYVNNLTNSFRAPTNPSSLNLNSTSLQLMDVETQKEYLKKLEDILNKISIKIHDSFAERISNTLEPLYYNSDSKVNDIQTELGNINLEDLPTQERNSIIKDSQSKLQHELGTNFKTLVATFYELNELRIRQTEYRALMNKIELLNPSTKGIANPLERARFNKHQDQVLESLLKTVNLVCRKNTRTNAALLEPVAVEMSLKIMNQFFDFFNEKHILHKFYLQGLNYELIKPIIDLAYSVNNMDYMSECTHLCKRLLHYVARIKPSLPEKHLLEEKASKNNICTSIEVDLTHPSDSETPNIQYFDSLCPDTRKIIIALAELEYQLLNFHSSAKLFQGLVNSNPQMDYTWHYQAAVSLYLTKQYQQSIKYFGSAFYLIESQNIFLPPSTIAQLHFELAQCLIQNGMHQEAAVYFNKSKEILHDLKPTAAKDIEDKTESLMCSEFYLSCLKYKLDGGTEESIELNLEECFRNTSNPMTLICFGDALIAIKSQHVLQKFFKLLDEQICNIEKKVSAPDSPYTKGILSKLKIMHEELKAKYSKWCLGNRLVNDFSIFRDLQHNPRFAKNDVVIITQNNSNSRPQ